VILGFSKKHKDEMYGCQIQKRSMAFNKNSGDIANVFNYPVSSQPLDAASQGGPGS